MMERRQAAGKQGTVRNETRDVRHETNAVHEHSRLAVPDFILLLPVQGIKAINEARCVRQMQ